MKVPFILISLAVHAVILTAPVSHVQETREQLFPVTLAIETMKPEPRSAPTLRKPKNSPDKSPIKRLERARPKQVKANERARPDISTHEKNPLKQEAIVSVAKDTLDRQVETSVLARAHLNVVQPLPTAPEKEPHPQATEGGQRKETIAGTQLPDLGNGKPPAPEQILLRAIYAYTPKPEYPDQARREGWEGTVLLSILVDTEGKSETIVLSRSSGFAALDAAAQDTVRHWRFWPARYGDSRVKSWVKVPIVFTLAEAKN